MARSKDDDNEEKPHSPDVKLPTLLRRWRDIQHVLVISSIWSIKRFPVLSGVLIALLVLCIRALIFQSGSPVSLA